MINRLRWPLRWPLRWALALIAVFLLASPGESTSVKALSEEDLVQDARTIFWGECVEVRSEWTADRRRIVTRVTFDLRETLKSDATQPMQPGGPTIDLVIPGGALDGVTYVVHGMPRFAPGEEVLVYASASHPSSGVRVPVGLAQGIYRVKRKDGVATARRDTREAHLVGPEGVVPGHLQELPLEALLARIRAQVRKAARPGKGR